MKTLFKQVLLSLVNSYIIVFHSIIIDIVLDILIFITNRDLALGYRHLSGPRIRLQDLFKNFNKFIEDSEYFLEQINLIKEVFGR